jgi:hypothetical protein
MNLFVIIVDTIKVRMMADTNRQFSGALHCTAMLLRHEGMLQGCLETARSFS